MVRLSALAYAVSILLAVSCTGGSGPPPAATSGPAFEAGRVVDAATLDGKVMFEYRGYFGCPGDEAALNEWPGWFDGPAEAEYAEVTYLPDVSDLSQSELCLTDMELPDGSRAHVFSSADPRTVDRHFEWMASYGIDGVFLRRAVGEPDDGVTRDFRSRVAENVRAGAEAHGRVFAIMYDLDRTARGDVVDDWAYVVSGLELTSSDDTCITMAARSWASMGRGLLGSPPGPKTCWSWYRICARPLPGSGSPRSLWWYPSSGRRQEGSGGAIWCRPSTTSAPPM